MFRKHKKLINKIKQILWYYYIYKTMDIIDSVCKRSYDGKINLILGNMFSGKSSALISRYVRYQIGGKKCMLIKYGRDNRYNETKIITHDKRYVIDAIPCILLCEVDHMIKDYDVICIDEIQFFKDAHIFCNKWANLGKIVEAGGLNGKFNLESWDVINKLVPLAYDIMFNRAVCKQTGDDAIFSHRIVASEEDELIGGEDMYQASDPNKTLIVVEHNGLIDKFLVNNDELEDPQLIENISTIVDLTEGRLSCAKKGVEGECSDR